AASYESHDLDEPYTTSLQQRQQQAEAYNRARDLSRPSSSSGSVPHILRRTPRLEARQLPRPQPTLFNTTQGSARRAPSAYPLDRAPHPALRISRRTASAILFALEEAIRTPHPFTPDLAEENAQMSDLGGGYSGRAANGGARAASGPVPVSQGVPSAVRTPRDIMNQRQAREAKKQAEADAERRAKSEAQHEDNMKRLAAERRAAATAGVAGQSRDSGGSRRTSGMAGERGSEESRVVSGTQQIDPSQGSGRVREERRTAPTFAARPRGTSVSQNMPLPADPQSSTRASGTRRAPPSQTQQRHVSAPLPTKARTNEGDIPPPRAAYLQETDIPDPASVPDYPPQPRDSKVSSFPHAFERWEQLSSHWEGLTSYWIRRLEANTEEVRREPLAQQMSRQISDLSAAGANLFHAVVELQRLRASSERKFQRWFFETRGDQERAQEIQGELEKMLQQERKARQDAVFLREKSDKDRVTAKKMVNEMKRELAISKEEARRAWEELGRREQEERERTASLREGVPTLVGGVQVVPMQAGVASRQISIDVEGSVPRSTAQRHEERDDSQEEDASPTDTDPFIETSRGQVPQLHHEPGLQSLAAGTYQPYPLGSTPATSGSTAQTAIPPPKSTSQQSQPLYSRDETRGENPSSFYQHRGGETYLHSPSTADDPTQRDLPRIPDIDQTSYVPSIEGTLSEGDEEYAMDEQGNVRRDAAGNPILYRRGLHGSRGASSQGGEDEYDVAADLERERQHARRYGQTSATSPVTAATDHHQPLTTTTGAADYSDAGYGDWEGMGIVGGRHHHPTRLSDVLEEDERSRTSPSRASLVGRSTH
ncbi:hypothetical protein BJ546DRAFT_852594, partial [Cryomyces antarcticus]